jgi:DNA-binding transcriptional MocR family regulator
MPKRFFRVGFGWPKEAELQGGLDAISTALRQ